MANRKLSLLVQAMNLFTQLDERDRQTLAAYVRSQTAAPRKKPTKKVETPILTGIPKSGSSAA
jgi:mono/diheme cytochrome c family protein